MTLANRLRLTLARRIGYEVTGQGFKRKHHTLTYTAALEWAHTYRRATITRRGQWIAETTTTQGA